METPQPHTSASGTGKVGKKKAGRKSGPNLTSPALRKAQNRAAQQAFRERKQQYIKELELDYQRLLNERDTYYKKNKQLGKENDILKCENWYLKGIVLSLQLVCFKSQLCIPKHTPHIDDRALQVMAESAPASIATYIDVKCHHPSPVSNDDIRDYSIRSSIPNDDDDDGNDDNDDRSPQTATVSASDQPNTIQFHHFHQNPTDNSSSTNDDTIKLQPVLLRYDTVANNLAAIQSLRIRLRLQSALFRENSVLHAITPTPLQLSVPHDPRIDLIPTPHMRDRMIIFQDQFDLDDCLRLLVNEAYFHGGDATMAGNWELPTSFFEKYWFLTIDYTQERTSKRLKRLRSNTTATTSVSLDQVFHHSAYGLQNTAHSTHHQHQQPTQPSPPLPLMSTTSIPALLEQRDYSVQQPSHANNCVLSPPPPPPPLQSSTGDPFELMLLQDNDILYQGQPLDSLQQTTEIEQQLSWIQSFAFDDL